MYGSSAVLEIATVNNYIPVAIYLDSHSLQIIVS